jgi:hypothetical protein
MGTTLVKAHAGACIAAQSPLDTYHVTVNV